MIYTILGYVGAVAMAAASFLVDYDIGKALAIMGLSMLTAQAGNARLWNLVILNLISIGGFSYALYI